MNESNLHNYQTFAVRHIIDHPEAGLLLDMGLGKTVSTLTAIKKLMDEYLEVNKVLIIAPKRVAESTWCDEIDKWEHLKGLKVSKILGTQKQRKTALKVSIPSIVRTLCGSSRISKVIGLLTWLSLTSYPLSNHLKPHAFERCV